MHEHVPCFQKTAIIMRRCVFRIYTTSKNNICWCLNILNFRAKLILYGINFNTSTSFHSKIYVICTFYTPNDTLPNRFTYHYEYNFISPIFGALLNIQYKCLPLSFAIHPIFNISLD